MYESLRLFTPEEEVKVVNGILAFANAGLPINNMTAINVFMKEKKKLSEDETRGQKFQNSQFNASRMYRRMPATR